jgi:hypothetical protein
VSGTGEEDEYVSARLEATLALAVRFVDAFTGRAPIGPLSGQPRVSMADFEVTPTVATGGYAVFRERPPTPPTLVVDGRGRFLDDRVPVGPGTLAADPPVAEVRLIPGPAYAFPPGTTLVYGLVRDAGGLPVTGADVTVAGTAIETETTRTGEFVLYVTDQPGWEVVDDAGTAFVRVAGENPQITVSHDDAGTGSARIEVRADRVTTAVLILDGTTLTVEGTRSR